MRGRDRGKGLGRAGYRWAMGGGVEIIPGELFIFLVGDLLESGGLIKVTPLHLYVDTQYLPDAFRASLSG